MSENQQEISQEEGETLLKIDLAYLGIEKAKVAYTNIFSKRSELDKLLDKETGYHQKKAMQLMRIMQVYLPIIIEGKKKLGIDWGNDNKVLERINKSFENIN